jgi:hypothetical protein
VHWLNLVGATIVPEKVPLGSAWIAILPALKDQTPSIGVPASAGPASKIGANRASVTTASESRRRRRGGMPDRFICAVWQGIHVENAPLAEILPRRERR